MSLNKIVDFHVYSDCELMKNIKVIQHIHGIQHITDKLLQTKSLEFTYESLVIFEASFLLASSWFPAVQTNREVGNQEEGRG